MLQMVYTIPFADQEAIQDAQEYVRIAHAPFHCSTDTMTLYADSDYPVPDQVDHYHIYDLPEQTCH